MSGAPPHIPFPAIDLSVDNPIPAIINGPEFSPATATIAGTEASKRSLISAAASALIYALVRNMRPKHVVEIGTFRGGTSEIICRALHENGGGILHTAGPFDAAHVRRIFRKWPRELKRHLQYYDMMSMELYFEFAQRGITPDIAFIDGDHSYEAALFDVQSLARMLARRGFLLVDNVSQTGPHYAAMDFLANNPDWIRCKVRDSESADVAKAFDRERSTIPETDFEILRAPSGFRVTARPITFGDMLSGAEVRGLKVDVGSGQGTLHVQCVLRGFGKDSIEEVTYGTIDIRSPGPAEVIFPRPLAIKGSFLRCSAEPWLVWNGDAPLQLTAAPVLIGDQPPWAVRMRSRAATISRGPLFRKSHIVLPVRKRGPMRRWASDVFRRIMQSMG
jgi:predicted O-methyltransferase YrrM